MTEDQKATLIRMEMIPVKVEGRDKTGAYIQPRLIYPQFQALTGNQHEIPTKITVTWLDFTDPEMVKITGYSTVGIDQVSFI